MKTRTLFYRHSLGKTTCIPPYEGLMQTGQPLDKPNEHRCSYCGEIMIPAAYYGVMENGVNKYYILDQEITREQFFAFSRADDKIFKQLQNHYEGV